MDARWFRPIPRARELLRGGAAAPLRAVGVRRAQTSSALSLGEVVAAAPPFTLVPPWPADLGAHPGTGAAATPMKARGPLRDGASDANAERTEGTGSPRTPRKASARLRTVDLKVLQLLKALSPVLDVLTGQVQLKKMK